MKIGLKEKHIKSIIIAMIVLLYCLLCLPNWNVSYKNNTIKSGKAIDGVPLLNNHVITQPVMFEREHVRSIGVALASISSEATGKFTCMLVDQEGNVAYSTTELIESFQASHVKWIRINIHVNPYQQYLMQYYVEGLEGEAELAVVSAEKATPECYSGFFFDEGEAEGRIVLDTSYGITIQKRDRLRFLVYAVILCLIVWFYKQAIEKKFFVISGLVTLVILDMHYTSVLRLDHIITRHIFFFVVSVFLVGVALQILMYLRGERRHERFFAVLMLMWGIIYSVTLPPLMAPDEPAHYAQAYKISNAVLGTPIEDELGNVIIRDTDALDYDRGAFSGYVYEVFGKIQDKNVEEESYISFETLPNKFLTPMYNYIASGLGITIARFLHLNYFWLVYMGRLFNLIAFTVIMYQAIRITPVGKLFMLNMSQIPILIENVSSYSYDVLVISMCALFTAYVLRIVLGEEKISKKDVIILLLLSAVIATLKYLYSPILLLVFFIPSDKFAYDSKKVVFFKTGMMLVALCSFVLIYKYGVLSMSTLDRWDRSVIDMSSQMEMEHLDASSDWMTGGEPDITSEDDEDDGNRRLVDEGEFPAYTIVYFQENSFRACQKIGYTLGKYLEDYFANAFGRLLARHNVYTPYFTFSFYFIWFLISLVCEDKERLSVGISYMALGIFLLFCVGMMTGALVAMGKPDDFDYVYGVQGRYFIPLFPMFVIAVRKTRFFVRDYMERYLVMTNIVQLLTIMFICLYMWEK